MVPNRGPKSMTNLWNFGTCDFLFFVKSITLKSFFHMIRGTGNLSNINKKSMRIRCSKKRCTNQETCSKREPEWGSKNIDKKWGSKKYGFLVHRPGAQDARPGINGGDFGGSLLVRFNIPGILGIHIGIVAKGKIARGKIAKGNIAKGKIAKGNI